MEKIKRILNKIGLPWAYHHFAENNPQKPPFVIYLYSRSRNYSADGKVYHKKNEVQLELYTDYKNPKLEEKIEEILDKEDIFYNKTEVYIESEKLYEVLYTFTL